MSDQLTQIWVPAGIIFAFQIQMVRWRIDREVSMEAQAERTWLPLCDYLNLVSMIVTAFFVFVGPILILDGDATASVGLAKYGVGLTAIFLIGYLVSLLGHYRLLWGGAGSRPRVPVQELIAVTITVIVAAAYVCAVWGDVARFLPFARMSAWQT